MSRTIDVPPERLGRWIEGFAERHGGIAERRPGETGLTMVGQDGALAVVEPPFPPIRGDLVEHALRARAVGAILLRLGGYAVGEFVGTQLVASKCGSRLVHGRNKAGGQSQRRFARRREKQAREAVEAAVNTVQRVLTPVAARLDAVVTGGDRAALRQLWQDPRLTHLHELTVTRVYEVPEPRWSVLTAFPSLYRRVDITLDP
ncbi:MAG: acVLRF1 family peptidyl-tRNA hydrolase [Mycobacteriales bacterium]